MLKMLAIADQKHLNHDNETELIDIIASEMQRQGLNPTNEDNFDSYLNSTPLYLYPGEGIGRVCTKTNYIKFCAAIENNIAEE